MRVCTFVPHHNMCEYKPRKKSVRQSRQWVKIREEEKRKRRRRIRGSQLKNTSQQKANVSSSFFYYQPAVFGRQKKMKKSWIGLTLKGKESIEDASRGSEAAAEKNWIFYYYYCYVLPSIHACACIAGCFKRSTVSGKKHKRICLSSIFTISPPPPSSSFTT